jgi:hypothetical protein
VIGRNMTEDLQVGVGRGMLQVMTLQAEEVRKPGAGGDRDRGSRYPEPEGYTY